MKVLWIYEFFSQIFTSIDTVKIYTIYGICSEIFYLPQNLLTLLVESAIYNSDLWIFKTQSAIYNSNLPIFKTQSAIYLRNLHIYREWKICDLLAKSSESTHHLQLQFTFFSLWDSKVNNNNKLRCLATKLWNLLVAHRINIV